VRFVKLLKSVPFEGSAQLPPDRGEEKFRERFAGNKFWYWRTFWSAGRKLRFEDCRARNLEDCGQDLEKSPKWWSWLGFKNPPLEEVFTWPISTKLPSEKISLKSFRVG
jgi:hypothetical protein